MGYDVSFEHSSKKVDYRLARDENGTLLYSHGLAPELAPQVRQDNYSYGHIPPQVAVIRAFEDWHAGSGYEDSEEDTGHVAHASHRYNYSRGVDASWSKRLYLSPAMQALLESDSSAIGAAPDYFSRTSDGVFLVAGRYIYEFNGTGWVERDDHGATDTHTGPVVDFNGTQFCPAGDSDPYVYSTDGATWQDVTTLSDTAAYKFIVRGQTSGAAVLWKISSTGALKNNTSGLSGGGVEWSAATQVGGTGETVGDMVVMDNDIVVFKTDGIYRYHTSEEASVTMEKVWDAGRLMFASNNGTNVTIWVNKKAYTTYGNVLLEYDNDANTVRFVWPRQDGIGNSELNGTVTAIAGDQLNLYFALKNSDGNTYIMKGNPDEGFHTVAYLGANDCDALLVAGAGDIHASNPSLLIGYGTAANYFILARAGLLPEGDSNYRFETSGFIYGTWDDVNVRGFTKFLNSGIILGRSLATGRSGKLSYEIDRSGDDVEILTGSKSGKTEKSIIGDVEFNRIRYRLDLTSTGNTITPIVDSIVLSTTLNNPRKQYWEVGVVANTSVLPNGSGDPRSGGIKLVSHLFDGKSKRVNFYDIDGTKHRTRIIDIKSVSVAKDTSGVQKSFAVSLVEI